MFITGKDIFIYFYKNEGFYELAFLELAKQAKWNKTWSALSKEEKVKYAKLFKLCKHPKTIESVCSKICDYCNGDGLSPHNGINRCGNCKGKGRILDKESYEWQLYQNYHMLYT